MKISKRWMMLSLAAILLGGYACRSSREATVAALEKMPGEERLRSVLASELHYRTLSANLRLSLKTGKKKETAIDARLRIVKNEAIQLSVRIPLLGSEAFRVLITPRRLLVIDRINRQYLSEPMSGIQAMLPFDFDYYSLEALLTNRLFIAGKKDIRPADYSTFKIREDDFQVNLVHTDRQGIRYDFASDHSRRIQSTRMGREKGTQLQCEYGDWGTASDRTPFPLRIRFLLELPENTCTATFAFKSVQVNAEFPIDDSLPAADKYRQITLPQLMKSIQKL
ncbi:MAG: DUF4292 domain-containing protein [Dysgonamonadaceae bacterium]|jgi:hypothetical protein|nr:DUF4292 domain-containing protein [Dysgonamonadaceae bacterium]